MKKDETPRSRPVTPANDNEIAPDPIAIDAALSRIAEVIGRHIAREHIRATKAANDNESNGTNPNR
ncbi:hypothetical protein [Sphingopyxis sp.]|uniref:hypothetical protein n=1 Tax=Sphingopyxis sp. TaxID=1908224 RepID=UPI0035AE0D78